MDTDYSSWSCHVLIMTVYLSYVKWQYEHVIHTRKRWNTKLTICMSTYIIIVSDILIVDKKHWSFPDTCFLEYSIPFLAVHPNVYRNPRLKVLSQVYLRFCWFERDISVLKPGLTAKQPAANLEVQVLLIQQTIYQYFWGRGLSTHLLTLKQRLEKATVVSYFLRRRRGRVVYSDLSFPTWEDNRTIMILMS